jgi:hypothetical protein
MVVGSNRFSFLYEHLSFFRLCMRAGPEIYQEDRLIWSGPLPAGKRDKWKWKVHGDANP